MSTSINNDTRDRFALKFQISHIRALLGFYVAHNCSFLQTFWEKLCSFFRVQAVQDAAWHLKMGR